MTPDDARAREREAREEVAAALCEEKYWRNPSGDHHDVHTCDACYAHADRAFAAVRAATLAAVRERVEGMNTEHDTTACPMCKFGLVCNDLMHRMTFNGALREVLAALDALAGEG